MAATRVGVPGPLELGPGAPYIPTLQARCRRCRRLGLHEPVTRTGSTHVGLSLPVIVMDSGFRCCQCSREWGFMFEGDENWEGLEG